MVIAVDHIQTRSPSVLVVHPRDEGRDRLLATIEGGIGGDAACIESLRELSHRDLTEIDVLLCAWRLPDGTGLDALARAHELRPGVPVVLAGTASDADHALAAFRAGATDFIVIDAGGLALLPTVIERCLAHQRVRSENERLQDELRHARGELARHRDEFGAVIDKLEQTARTDELTGLANRRWFNAMLEGSWAEAARYDLPLACMMIDLDRFKELNDARGHLRGDDVLRLAGDVIRSNCREVDTTARYGGDEFCVLMPHAEARDAIVVAHRIQVAFAAAMAATAGHEPHVGMTIGVADNRLGAPEDAEQLVALADEALYRGKAAGRNQVVVQAGASC
ncbi:MAG: GGDEF domain-containing protein [Planctomycetota bacterium]|jgi:diguanylate cyclase (GGDEF)-like protein